MKKTLTIVVLILCVFLSACSISQSKTENNSSKSQSITSAKGKYDIELTAEYIKEDNDVKSIITNNTGDLAISIEGHNIYRKVGNDWESLDLVVNKIDIISYIYPFEGKNTEERFFQAYSSDEAEDKRKTLEKGEYKLRVYTIVYDPVEFLKVKENGKVTAYIPKYKESDAKKYYIETNFTVE